MTGFLVEDGVSASGCMNIWDTVANGRSGREGGNDWILLGVILFVGFSVCEANGEEIEGLG